MSIANFKKVEIMAPAEDTKYSLGEIVALQAGGGDAGVVISTENLRALMLDIERHPDFLLKSERVGRTSYLVKLSLKLTPARLSRESTYA